MAPPKTGDSLGQEVGNDAPYIRGVPCSIEQLSGREAEAAHQTFGAVSLKVAMYGDPRKPITIRHRLKVGERILEIADVKDVNQNGQELELLCGERT